MSTEIPIWERERDTGSTERMENWNEAVYALF